MKYTNHEKSKPGLGHLISAPIGRALFIPESMVNKIEQKDLKRDMEESIAKKLAEKWTAPSMKYLMSSKNFLKKLIVTSNRKNWQKLKRLGIPHDEVNQHFEESKQYQENFLLQSKENKGTEDRHSSRQPGEDPNNYQQLQQSKSHDYQGKQESRDHQKKQENLHSVEGHRNTYSQPSHSSVMRPSVNKQQQKHLADTGYGPGKDITVGSVVQLPNTGDGAEIFGIVRLLCLM